MRYIPGIFIILLFIFGCRHDITRKSTEIKSIKKFYYFDENGDIRLDKFDTVDSKYYELFKKIIKKSKHKYDLYIPFKGEYLVKVELNNSKVIDMYVDMGNYYFTMEDEPGYFKIPILFYEQWNSFM